MTVPHPGYRPRGAFTRTLGWSDDFTSWLLYGYETWLVALLKGVPMFLFVYFMLAYIPNYVYYAVTNVIPFLRFSADVGFLVAAGVATANFVILIVLAVLIQAARGRRGFGWSFVRILTLLLYLFVVLVLIPLLAFNLAGGSFLPPRFPLQAVAFGLMVAGLGAGACAYLWLEYRRITRREADEATVRSAALARR